MNKPNVHRISMDDFEPIELRAKRNMGLKNSVSIRYLDSKHLSGIQATRIYISGDVMARLRGGDKTDKTIEWYRGRGQGHMRDYILLKLRNDKAGHTIQSSSPASQVCYVYIPVGLGLNTDAVKPGERIECEHSIVLQGKGLLIKIPKKLRVRVRGRGAEQGATDAET